MPRHHVTPQPLPRSLVLLLAAALVTCGDPGAPVSPATSSRTDRTGMVATNDGAARNCASVAGTVAARFVTAPQRGWEGRFLVSFGGGPVERAALFDRNTSADRERQAAGLPFRGTETITVTFPDGAFDIAGEFVGVPGPTPGLYELNETGDVVNGSGRFLGSTGHVSIHGPFVLPPVFGPLDTGPNPLLPPWIAEVHGSICGL